MTTENDIKLFKINEALEKKLIDSLEIEEHVENVIAEENEEAVFECKVEGDPQPICVWYRNGKQITSSQRTKITSNRKWHRLEIRKVRADDHGIYTIVCRNSSKQLSSTASLFVIKNKLKSAVYYSLSSTGNRVVRHLCNVKVTKGARIDLEVVFLTDSIGQCIWFKNNEVIHQDTRTIIRDSNRATALSILKSELTDSGVYFVVSKSKYGIVSSFSDVQVTAVNELTNDNELPVIEEFLPDEAETNEGEEIRLICRAIYNKNTTIQWYKNKGVIENSNFVAEDYGNNHIGLRVVKGSKADSGKYSVLLRDQNTGSEKSSSCILTVNPSPINQIPKVKLMRPLESAVACYGASLTFDCSFHIEDPSYLYVVWKVGHYKAERTNTRFSVICKGGEFLLHIKKLEPGMGGDISCELRRALPGQRTVHVCSSSSALSVVPPTILCTEMKNASAKTGKIYDKSSRDISIRVYKNNETEISSTAVSTGRINGNGVVANCDSPGASLEITCCRLDEKDMLFIHASMWDSEIFTERLRAYEKDVTDLETSTNLKTVVIEWDDAMASSAWYSIDIGQNNDHYIEAGVSSIPRFVIEDLPVGRMMKFRVRTVPIDSTAHESHVCIVPTPEIIIKPSKNHELRAMDDFELLYTKTNDLIGCGAFGSVILVHDAAKTHYAAKILKTRTQKKRDTAMREFEMMQKLSHPKLVELIDAFMAKDMFIIVMDYLWGGELFDRIVEEEHIKEVDVVPYVRQICEALEYIHSHKIAHLDLKPENIICLSRNSGQVKIIDFGLARVLEDGNITRAIYGTRDYVAPEVLNFERLTLACDMWSFGVVTYMLLSGVMPFAGDSWPEQSANITMARYNYDETAFREISDLAKDFVDQLLLLKAEKRMSATTALHHQWIKEGPPKGAKAGHMKRTRENLKSYLANYRARWQRAGNVMIAAHRLRTHASGQRASAMRTSDPRIT